MPYDIKPVTMGFDIRKYRYLQARFNNRKSKNLTCKGIFTMLLISNKNKTPLDKSQKGLHDESKLCYFFFLFLFSESCIVYKGCRCLNMWLMSSGAKDALLE